MDDRMREARRRRILENSQSRYQKIMGLSQTASLQEETLEKPVQSAETVTPTPSRPTVETDVSTTHEHIPQDAPRIRQRNQMACDPEKLIEPVSFINEKVNEDVVEEKLPFGLNGLGNAPEKENNVSLLILALTAVSTITILFLDYGGLIGNNVLLPFLVYEIFSIILSKEENEQPGGVMNMVLMMFKLPREKLLQLTKILQKCRLVFQDFCVYIFILVICFQVFKLNT